MCFDYSDGEPVKNYQDRVVTRARKPRTCHECGEKDCIKPGDSYFEARFIHEKRWDSWVCCARCWLVREIVIAHEKAEGCNDIETKPPWNELSDVLDEVVETFGARGAPDYRRFRYHEQLGLPRLSEVARW